MDNKPGQCLLLSRLRRIKKKPVWLSEQTGIPEGRISEYINGKRYMNLMTARKISKIIGCQIEELYEWPD